MARIVLAKLGTDAHDYGVRMIAKWLADAGHEVIYLGLYNTPARVARAVVDEGPDLVGISFLGGEPVYLSARVIETLRLQGADDLPVIVGGVITPEMIEELKALGVAAVFTPGTRREALVAEIARVLEAHAPAH
jgi:methylmalonyl-CoA mutase C-terminal domain/subunit